jgi:hypothetical protein
VFLGEGTEPKAHRAKRKQLTAAALRDAEERMILQEEDIATTPSIKPEKFQADKWPDW